MAHFWTRVSQRKEDFKNVGLLLVTQMVSDWKILSTNFGRMFAESNEHNS